MDVELPRDLATAGLSGEALKDAFVDAAFGPPGGVGFAKGRRRPIFSIIGVYGPEILDRSWSRQKSSLPTEPERAFAS